MLKSLAQSIPSRFFTSLGGMLTSANRGGMSDPVAWFEPASTNSFLTWNGGASSDVAFSVMDDFNAGSRAHDDIRQTKSGRPA